MANSKSTGSGNGGLGKITALLLTAAMMVGTGIFTTLGEATTEAQNSTKGSKKILETCIIYILSATVL